MGALLGRGTHGKTIAAGVAALGIAGVAGWFAAALAAPRRRTRRRALGLVPRATASTATTRPSSRPASRSMPDIRNCRTRRGPSSMSCASCAAGPRRRPVTRNPCRVCRVFLAWMEDYLDEFVAERPKSGRVGLQRLNRREYATPSETCSAWRSIRPPFCRRTRSEGSTTTRARYPRCRCSSVISSMPRASWRTSGRSRLAALGSEVYSGNTQTIARHALGQPLRGCGITAGAGDG